MFVELDVFIGIQLLCTGCFFLSLVVMWSNVIYARFSERTRDALDLDSLEEH